MYPELNRRFDHHPPKDAETIELHTLTRDNVKHIAEIFHETLPEGREKALALTKLEEALFWANAAIARS